MSETSLKTLVFVVQAQNIPQYVLYVFIRTVETILEEDNVYSFPYLLSWGTTHHCRGIQEAFLGWLLFKLAISIAS